MKRSGDGVGAAATTVALLGVLLSTPDTWAGGGGANAVFSLDRTSPTRTLYGYSAADLLVDDAGYGPGTPLTLALPAVGLGLAAGANVEALSSGRDNGLPAILGSIGLVPNPLDIEEVRYQYSANRTAIDGVTGPVDVPFVGLVNIEQSTPTFPDQFTNLDQAADVFDNAAAFDRFNFVMAVEEYFKLLGAPSVPIDNLDALESLGSFGVSELDANADFRPDVPVYFTVDEPTGLPTSTIFVKPPGFAPRMGFAVAGQLGLDPLDDIDALSIWDVAPGGGPADMLFNPGDGIVFSLAESSPSLPRIIDGVTIDEGGIFLAVPGAGIIAALPGGYFSLSPGDELDAIHVVDPRVSPLFPCLMNGTGPTTIRPFEALSVVQSTVGATLDGPPVHLAVYLNETERPGDASGVIEYTVTAMSLDPAVAIVESAVPSWCGWQPGFPSGQNHCEQCAPEPPPEGPTWTGPCPGATGTLSASWIRGFEGSTTPRIGPNVCLGDFHIKPVGPGSARIILSGTAGGSGGAAKVVAPADVVIQVIGNTSGVREPGGSDVGRFALQVGPNPSLGRRSAVTFQIPEPGGRVTLMVFDLAGRRVRTLMDATIDAGGHEITWDGAGDSGNAVGPGLYLVRLQTPWGQATRKLMQLH